MRLVDSLNRKKKKKKSKRVQSAQPVKTIVSPEQKLHIKNLLENCNLMQTEAAELFSEKKYSESAALWQKIIEPFNEDKNFSFTIVGLEMPLANALYNHACCLDELEIFPEQALKEYEQAYKLDPREDIYVDLIGKLFASKDYEKLKQIVAVEEKIMDSIDRPLGHKSLTFIALAQLVSLGQLEVACPDIFITCLLSMASQVFPHAHILLIQHHLNNLEFTEAKNCIKQAKHVQKIDVADLMSAEAHYYTLPDSLERNFQKGLKLFNTSIKLKPTPRTHYCLARLYQGEGLPDIAKDIKLAEKHYKSAIEGRFPEAAHDLATLYAEGKEEVKQDIVEALKLYQIAVDLKHFPSYENYAILLSQQDALKNRELCLSLLSQAPQISSMAQCLYIQLKLFEVKSENGNILRYGPLPQGQRPDLTEIQTYYDKLQELSKDSEISPAELQLLSASIAKHLLNNLEMAADHYRAAAEYGSKEAHQQLLSWHLNQLLNSTSETRQRYHKNSLRNVIDSQKFFFGDPPPIWLSHISNIDRLRSELGMTEEKNSESKFESIKIPSFQMKNNLFPKKELRKLINTIKTTSMPTDQLAELVVIAGELAKTLIIKSAPECIDFLHEQLLFLLKTVNIRAETEYFKNWSLMAILNGISQFRLYSKNSELAGQFQKVFKLILSRLPTFISWKLVMLLDSVTALSYLQPGVREFIQSIITYTLERWWTFYTELDGSIQLCYHLAELDNYYHFFTDPKLEKQLTQLITDIITKDFSLYQSRNRVIKNCFFALVYFHDIYKKSNDNGKLFKQLQSHLENKPVKTTCSAFQTEVNTFFDQYFSYAKNISCLDVKEEKRVATKPVDCVRSYEIRKSGLDSEEKSIVVELGVESDGPGHFFFPTPEMKLQPVYNIKTLFSTTIHSLFELKMVRFIIFEWQTQSTSELYQSIREKLAKFGLDFPSYTELMLMQKDRILPKEHKTEPTPKTSTSKFALWCNRRMTEYKGTMDLTHFG